MECWHHHQLGAAPKATGLAQCPECAQLRDSPCQLSSMPASHPSQLNLETHPLPESPKASSCVILSFTCTPFQGSTGHSFVAPDLFFILSSLGRMMDGSTLENPLEKGWAILHFHQACPGDFESSHLEPFGCRTLSVGPRGKDEEIVILSNQAPFTIHPHRGFFWSFFNLHSVEKHPVPLIEHPTYTLGGILPYLSVPEQSAGTGIQATQ